LFPKLKPMSEAHRATEFRRACRRLKISGITLHSYRYAWAERARSCGYPERFAQEALGHQSLDELIDATVPKGIRLNRPLRLPEAKSEYNLLRELRGIAAKNKVFKSYIGMGYYGTITPAVIQRNILENPGWYTQYTPYQAEISQGRLESLLNFQTMVADLTALPIANASLLDEATAAAEAMTMSHRLKDGRNVFFISETCHPQTIEVVRSGLRC